MVEFLERYFSMSGSGAICAKILDCKYESDSDSSDDEEDLNERLIKIENIISTENDVLDKKKALLIPEELEKTSYDMMIENKLNGC